MRGSRVFSNLVTYTVVWKYFVGKKILWAMKSTKFITQNFFSMNNKQGAQPSFICTSCNTGILEL